MSNERKRALVREYKERKVRRGVYALRCPATGETWVSASSNLDAQENSVRFQLRTGGHPNKALQAVFNAHGADGLTYEVLAELPDEEASAYALRADLKDLEETWRAQLNARKVVG